jgi:hypothetical protein
LLSLAAENSNALEFFIGIRLILPKKWKDGRRLLYPTSRKHAKETTEDHQQ